MATFIHYQPPRTVAPASGDKVRRPPARHQHPPIPHGLPATLGLPASISSERSWQSAGSHTMNIRDGVEVVDLTDSDQEGPTPERQAAEDGQPGAEGECTTPNNDSRESTVTVTGDATGGDGHDDSDGNLDLPTLNDLFFKAKAMSRMAVSEPGREPEKPTDPKPLVHNGSVKGGHLAGDRAAGQSPDAGTPVDNSPDGSQDAPIVLDDDKPDSELDATTSDDDDEDRTHESTPPPSANDRRTSVPAVSTKNPSEDSVHDERGLQDRSRTASNHTDVESGGLYSGHLANTERDGCEPSHQMEDQQRREPTRSNPTPPNPLNASSRKRSGPSTASQAPSPKRTRGSSRVAARKAREAEGMPTNSHCHKEGEETLRHVFPRHCRDKEWEVVDIGGVCLEEDGSLNCKLLWAPTTALVSSLKGALLGRAEELVKRDLGADAWDKWLEMQGKTGRRCRSKGANSQGGK